MIKSTNRIVFASQSEREHVKFQGVMITVHKVLISPWRREKIGEYVEWVEEAGGLKSTARRDGRVREISNKSVREPRFAHVQGSRI